MKNILITIIAGITLAPVVLQGQTNTMYFCCSHQAGGGCSPVGYATETACKAACTETQYCDVRSVGATAGATTQGFGSMGIPYGYSPYGGIPGYMGYMGYPGYAPAMGPGPMAPAVRAPIDTTTQTTTQSETVSDTMPATTTTAGSPVQQQAQPTAVGAGTRGAPGTQTTVVTTTTRRATS